MTPSLRSLSALALALALPVFLVPTSASAGRLGEFRDSIQRDGGGDRERGRGAGGDDSDEDNDFCFGCDYEDPSADGADTSWLWELFGLALAGHRPGEAFSWGRSPYDGRGPTLDPRSAKDALSTSRRVHYPRPAHFRGRLEGLALTDGSASGLGIFALFETTRSPGLAFWHQRIMDFGASDRLGVSTLTLEPRIVTARHATLSWNVGGVVYGSENGLVNAGVQAGIGLVLTPVRPLMVELRGATQAMPGATVGDVYAALGAEFVPGVFATVGYRGLYGPEVPLHMGTVGIQIDIGFGGVGRPAKVRPAAY